MGSNPDSEAHFLHAFEEYLHGKVSKEVSYEYIRQTKKFMAKMYGESFGMANESFRKKLADFLDIPNPNTYRNRLAALKHLFKFLASEDYLKDYKYKATMPSFSIATPSLEQIREFGKAIENDKMKLYYYLGITSAIRPEHLLRLMKKLFDRQNNMINTWMKTFGKKNFFFSFYTDEIKPQLEQYLDQLSKDDSLLFPLGYRYVQDVFERASKKSGIKITPKMMRKFSTNWLRRHGMIPEDVDVITSHLPYGVVARHYLDTSRIREEYVKATTDLRLL